MRLALLPRRIRAAGRQAVSRSNTSSRMTPADVLCRPSGSAMRPNQRGYVSLSPLDLLAPAPHPLARVLNGRIRRTLCLMSSQRCWTQNTGALPRRLSCHHHCSRFAPPLLLPLRPAPLQRRSLSSGMKAQVCRRVCSSACTQNWSLPARAFTTVRGVQREQSRLNRSNRFTPPFALLWFHRRAVGSVGEAAFCTEAVRPNGPQSAGDCL
jgi:hypothetical protein